MTTNRDRRGPLNLRVTAAAAGIRVWGLGEVALDPAEARDLAAQLLAAADEADVLASQLVPGTGCTVHLEPSNDGVTLRATHPTGQGRWLSAPHPLDGTTWPSEAAAWRAALGAGLCRPTKRVERGQL